jgi:hypothetical protein
MRQAALVRSMCTSGARLQLAIAPAGAGKTTAMRTLARAWAHTGQVIGFAPSAAAAAKLMWSIHHNDLPDWAERIGPASLVIIDEAGMADTLSLDTAVRFIIGRGGSVRPVGDDQQPAAIGGGALRDIDASHGALRLTELHRFTDPAEAVATLALRDGRPEALGFYLDRRRIHVGDPTTTIDNVSTPGRPTAASRFGPESLNPRRPQRWRCVWAGPLTATPFDLSTVARSGVGAGHDSPLVPHMATD